MAYQNGSVPARRTEHETDIEIESGTRTAEEFKVRPNPQCIADQHQTGDTEVNSEIKVTDRIARRPKVVNTRSAVEKSRDSRSQRAFTPKAETERSPADPFGMSVFKGKLEITGGRPVGVTPAENGQNFGHSIDLIRQHVPDEQTHITGAALALSTSCFSAEKTESRKEEA